MASSQVQHSTVLTGAAPLGELTGGGGRCGRGVPDRMCGVLGGAPWGGGAPPAVGPAGGGAPRGGPAFGVGCAGGDGGGAGLAPGGELIRNLIDEKPLTGWYSDSGTPTCVFHEPMKKRELI